MSHPTCGVTNTMHSINKSSMETFFIRLKSEAGRD